MTILVRANETQKAEVLEKNTLPEVNFIWYDNTLITADLYIDFLYESNDNIFQPIQTNPVLINGVCITNQKLQHNFIRFNGWNGFFKNNVIECVCISPLVEKEFNIICEKLGWKFQLVADEIGMITPRSIAMIINEAYFAIEDNIASKFDIDIAMKLGTNYPFGPFEWSEKIGLQNIHQLLSTLSKTENRYLPSKALSLECL